MIFIGKSFILWSAKAGRSYTAGRKNKAFAYNHLTVYFQLIFRITSADISKKWSQLGPIFFTTSSTSVFLAEEDGFPVVIMTLVPVDKKKEFDVFNFFNFSCMFLNPNIFFPIWILIVLIY